MELLIQLYEILAEYFVAGALFAVVGGAGVAVILWLAMRFIPLSAATRHGLCFVALLGVAVAPLAYHSMRALPRLQSYIASAADSGQALLAPMKSASVAMAPSTATELQLPTNAIPQNSPSVSVFNDTPASVATEELFSLGVPQDIANVIFALWIAVSGFFLLRLAIATRALLLLKRFATPVDDAARNGFLGIAQSMEVLRPTQLLLSDRAQTPMVIGFVSPVVLAPRHMVSHINAEEWTDIITHELSHIARRDDWTMLSERLMVALSFFNPAALWLGRRLDLERELACDDRVILGRRRAKPYAATLVHLAELVSPARTISYAPGALWNKPDVLIRVESALKDTVRRTDPRSRAAILAIGGALVTLVAYGALAAPALHTYRVSSPHSPLPPRAPHFAGATESSESSFDESKTDLARERARHRRLGESADIPSIPGVATISENTVACTDNGHQFSYSNGLRKVTIDYDGEFTLTDDESDIASVTPGGYFRITEKKPMSQREIEIFADANGRLDRTFFVRGKQRDYDDGGQEWLAEILDDMGQHEGLFAKQRVTKAYRKGGVSAVLDIIVDLDGDYLRRSYLDILYETAELSDSDLSEIADAVARSIDSDYERVEALLAITAQPAAKKNTLAACVATAKRIDSDYEKRRFLTALSQGNTHSLLDATEMADVATTMDSDYERAEFLIALLDERDSKSPEALVAIAEQAADIESGYEAQRVLKLILDADNVDAEVARALVAASERIDGDYERSETLLAVARAMDNSEAMIEDCIRATARMESGYEKQRVIEALVSNSTDLSERSIESVLQAVIDMDGHYEKSQILTTLAPHCLNSESLKDAFYEAVESLDGDFERSQLESVMSRLERKERRTSKAAEPNSPPKAPPALPASGAIR